MEKIELTDMQKVFGADVILDEHGRPVEKGVGSTSQRTPHPTEKPSVAPTKDQMDFLHRMIAASGSADLAKDFREFLKWRNERTQDAE